MTAASELCEDNQSKWKNMLRTNGSSQKPQWKAAIKVLILLYPKTNRVKKQNAKNKRRNY